MANSHSKRTVILVDSNDISAYCNTSNFEVSSGTEDTTTYGKDAQVFDPTLLTGACGFGGVYDTTASGPRAVLRPLVGTKVVIVHRPEGTGSGLPMDTFDAVIEKYNESAPVAGYRQWACDVKPSDDIDSTDQV